MAGYAKEEESPFLSVPMTTASWNGKQDHQREPEWTTKAKQPSMRALHRQRNLLCLSNVVLLVFVLLGLTMRPSDKKTLAISKPERTSLTEMINRGRSFRADNRDNVHIVMVAKDITKPFCQSVFSMLVNGFPAPHVMHFQQPYTGWADKLDSFDQYLAQANIRPDDTMFLLDGYDLVFQLPIDVALSRYTAAGKDLFFGADKRCWPVRNEEPPCMRMPQSQLATDIYGEKTDYDPWERPRWLNAGAVIGPARTLKPIMHEAWQRAQDKARNNLEVNDQGILADILTEDNATYSYTTDSLSTIFQTMIISEVDVVWDINPDPRLPATVSSPLESSQRAPNLHDIQLQTDEQRARSFWWNRPLARNIRSNEIPVALHYNGPDQKTLMQQWWPSNWFARPDVRGQLLDALHEERQPNGAGVWIKDQWKPFEEVCGQFPLF